MNEPTWVREESAGETLAENWLLKLRRERFRSRISGKTHDYYLIYLADAVNVVALTPDRQVILVRQFRAGSGHDSLETPGGLLDPGEDPLMAGPRELKEETGFAGDPPVVLGTVWSNASILTSKTTFLLVTNALQVAEPKLDHSEEVAVELVPADRIPEFLNTGQIDHALAVGSLLWWLVREQASR
jgi:8-oxo-dGTP pyrophosphatase MutT (NUDIX family)